jgi:hypothetical protein
MDRDIFFSIVESANFDKIKIESPRFYALPQNNQYVQLSSVSIVRLLSRITSDGKTPLHLIGCYETNGSSHSNIYRFLCDVGKHHLNTKDRKGTWFSFVDFRAF